MRALVQATVALAVLATLTIARPAGCEPRRDWRARFELERPSMLRAVEGEPGPPGYVREVHYDGRRLGFGVGYLAFGMALQLLVVASQGVEAAELVPCLGLFYGDYGSARSNNGYADLRRLGRALMAAPVCALDIGGSLQLSLALADPRPVWVRKQARAAAVRLRAGLGREFLGVHAIAQF